MKREIERENLADFIGTPSSEKTKQLDYSPYNLHGCPTTNDKCICTIISMEELNALILSDYTSNTVFRTTWILFKCCIDQFDDAHYKIKTRNCKEMLLDFYKNAYLKTKEMKVKLNEYFSFEKEKECIIKCNVNEMIDKFLVIVISHINLLSTDK